MEKDDYQIDSLPVQGGLDGNTQMTNFPMEELFCIDGKADFIANVTSAFKDLRNEPHLTDVTLATEDDQVLKAHKVVISSCSTFFRDILYVSQIQDYSS